METLLSQIQNIKRTNKHSKLFFAFEGCDGTGKSTHVENILETLTKKNIPVKYTKAPTSRYKEEIENSQISQDRKLIYFLLDRLQHQQEIESMLAEGYHVICDRYDWSTLAYNCQNEKTEKTLRDFKPLIKIQPDFYLYFEAPLLDMERRINKRERRSCFEDLEFLAKVKNRYEIICNYYEQSHSNSILKINTTNTLAENSQLIEEFILKKINNLKLQKLY